jgi:hypothetical protein
MGKQTTISLQLSEHDALVLFKLVKHQMEDQEQNLLPWSKYWQRLTNQLSLSIENSYDADSVEALLRLSQADVGQG